MATRQEQDQERWLTRGVETVGEQIDGAFDSSVHIVTSTALYTRSRYRQMSNVLHVIRAPALVALFSFIVFALPGQIHEIYRLFAEDLVNSTVGEGARLRVAAFFAMLWATGFVLWYVARVLTLVDPLANNVLHENSLPGRVARWVPRFLGAAPSLGVALGSVQAGLSETDMQVRMILLGAAGVGLLFAIWRIWWSYRRTGGNPELYDDLKHSWLRTDLRVLLSLTLLGVIVYLMTSPIAFTQALGTLSILCFFFIALVFAWAQLSYLYDRWAIPAVSVLILCAFGFSIFDLNDNHHARLIEPVEIGEQPMDIEEAFEQWYRGRADRIAFERAGKPYPVYLVAAQGGGLYAAYQSAMFLARMQDECPNFTQHVFAMSGVSGGAVGTTVFTSLAQRYAPNIAVDDPEAYPCGNLTEEGVNFEQLTRDLLKRDFLSPLASALLFPDLTARFSPVPIPQFDRAVALERAFEQTWADIADTSEGNPLEEGLLSYWSPFGSAPVLMVNTTEADSGRQLVFSPVPDLGPDLRSYATLAVPARNDAGEVEGVPDMRLSTVMGLSARFPYITPAGSVTLQETRRVVVPGNGAVQEEQIEQKARLVDGGYFENSGISTAIEVMRLLQKKHEDGLIDLRLIVFDLTEDRFRAPSYALGEISSPIKALLNVRTSRSKLVQNEVRREFGDRCRYIRFAGRRPSSAADEICPSGIMKSNQVWSVSLNDAEYDFQLGWILSNETLTRIQNQIGRASACELGRGFESGAHDLTLSRAVSAPSGEAASDPGADAASEEKAEQLRDDEPVRKHNSCIARFIKLQLQRKDGL
ncbi:MAG: hypothetical protein MRY63_03140 [Neomegalonema sp.]|nr:hypothetical protein [Neomegalonema sp.]